MLTKMNSYVQVCRMATAKFTPEDRKPIRLRPLILKIDRLYQNIQPALLAARRMYSTGFIDEDLQCTVQQRKLYFWVRR